MAYKAPPMMQLNEDDVQRIAKIEGLDPEVIQAHFLYVDAGEDEKGNRIKKMVVKYDGWKFKMNQHYGYGKWTAQAVLPIKEEVDSFLQMMGPKLNGMFFCLMKGRVFTPDNPIPHEDFSHATIENAKGNSQEFLPEVASARAIRRVLERVTPWKNPKGYLMAEELKPEDQTSPVKEKPESKTKDDEVKVSKASVVLSFLEAFSGTYKIDKNSVGWDKLFTLWATEKSHKIQAPASCKTFWDKIEFIAGRPEGNKLLEEYIVLLTPAYAAQVRRSERLVIVNQKLRTLVKGDKELLVQSLKYLSQRMNVEKMENTSATETATAQCEVALKELEDGLPPYLETGLATDILLNVVNPLKVSLPLLNLDLKARLGVGELSRPNILSYTGQIAELVGKNKEKVQKEILSRKA